jgi:RNA polymerase sigma-70 factor (ECF subfamily)
VHHPYDIDDDATVARLVAGDEDVFAALVIAWTPAMLRLAEQFVPNVQAAEEVVQDTWMAVITGIDRFQGRSRLRTWVVSILVNVARQTGRRERRSIPFSAAWRDEHAPAVDPRRFRPHDAPEDAQGWLYPLPRWHLRPDDGAQNAELSRVLDAAIAALPRRQQQVLMARDVWGCDAAEACELLGLTANHQRVLLHRARAQVRNMVEAYLSEEQT